MQTAAITFRTIDLDNADERCSYWERICAMARAPIVFEASGEAYTPAGTVIALVWEGETTVGDRVELRLLGNDAVLWAARTEVSQTYISLNLAPGVEAPKGVVASVLTAGRVLVYVT